MTCDKYQDALLLAAASNDRLNAKLARHLEHCPTCRTTLRSERELFSRIDSTLRAQVNEDPPPTFLAQLRLQLLKEVTARRGSDRVWHVTGAALALVLVAAFYPLIGTRQSNVPGNRPTHTIGLPQSVGVRQFARAGGDLEVRSPHHFKRPAAQRAVRQEPEVLVPQDEQKAFAQFLARVAQRDPEVQALVMPAENKTVNSNTELPQVSFVDVADLKLGQLRQKERINQTVSSE